MCVYSYNIISLYVHEHILLLRSHFVVTTVLSEFSITFREILFSHFPWSPRHISAHSMPIKFLMYIHIYRSKGTALNVMQPRPLLRVDNRWTLLCSCRTIKCTGIVINHEYLKIWQYSKPYILAYTTFRTRSRSNEKIIEVTFLTMWSQQFSLISQSHLGDLLSQ